MGRERMDDVTRSAAGNFTWLENLIILNDIAIAQNRVFNQLVQLHLVPVLDQPAAFFIRLTPASCGCSLAGIAIT